MGLKEDALVYHEAGRPGKLKVLPSKPTVTAEEGDVERAEEGGAHHL